MGFADGFNAGSSMVNNAVRLRDQRDERIAAQRLADAREARDQGRYDNEQRQVRREDDAVRGLEALHTGGVVTQQGTGLSMPSAQMLAGEGYGDATGAQAIRDAASDSLREERRFGIQPTMNPQADIQSRKATDSELTGAAQRVALARRDMASYSALETKRRDDDLKTARRDEFKRISKLPPEELVSGFHQSVNDNPDMPFMVDFDKKSNKYMLVSRAPGIPSQTLSKAEMTQAMMGMWEAGNGDYQAGMQAMISAATQQRTMQNQDFERSQKLATGNADVYYKGRNADNDDARTRNDATRTGIAREQLGIAKKRAEQEDWSVIGASDDNRGLIQYNRRSGKMEIQPLPDGTDARGLFRKITGEKGDKPFEKVPEDGSRVRDRRGNVLTYNEGEPVLSGGFAPSARPKVMDKLGLPPTADSLVKWESGGRHVSVPGDSDAVYDLADKNDVALLRQAVERASTSGVMADEVNRRGFSPRYSGGPGPDAAMAIERQRAQDSQRAQALGRRPEGRGIQGFSGYTR